MISKKLLMVTCLSLCACATTPKEVSLNRATGIPVLMYHQITVDKPVGETVITPEKFAEEMKYLHDNNYQTLSIDELVDIMNKKMPEPQKAVVLTFDDGWTSMFDNGIPILKSFHMKATFCIVSSFLDKSSEGLSLSNLTPDQIFEKTSGQYMNEKQLELLIQTPEFQIESHTVTHPWHVGDNLVSWDEGKTKGRGEVDVMTEIVVSKFKLEQLSPHIDYIAWPAGWYNTHLLQLSEQAGYRGAMMAWGNGGNHPGDDPFQIKRVTVSGLCNMEQFQKIVENTGDSTQCKN